MTKEETKIKNYLNYLKSQPNRFFRDILGIEPWKLQIKINNLIAKETVVSIRSCHASGKTWDLAGIVLWFLYTHPNSKVITTAPTFTQVEDVLWREIRTMHEKSFVPLGGKILKTSLEMGTDWFAIGLSTNKPENFSGWHSKNILIVADEASGIEDQIYEAIDGLMAGGNCKLIMIGNPTQGVGYFAESFKLKTHIKISAFDTPNVIARKVEVLGLITWDWVQMMEKKYGKDSDVYRVRVLGDPPQRESDYLIMLNQVEEAMAREVDPDGDLVMGVDVARFGTDKTIILIRRGYKVLEKIEIGMSDTMEVVGKVVHLIKDKNIKPENVRVDVIGIGAGVVDRLREQDLEVMAVNVGEKASDSEHFSNQRAEGYWRLRDLMDELDLINDEDFYQLANIKYKYNSRGQLQIESKEDMKKRGLHSPDCADALMISFLKGSDEEVKLHFI